MMPDLEADHVMATMRAIGRAAVNPSELHRATGLSVVAFDAAVKRLVEAGRMRRLSVREDGRNRVRPHTDEFLGPSVRELIGG